MVQSKLVERMSRPEKQRSGLYRLTTPSRLTSFEVAGRPKQSDLWRVTVKSEDEAEDVIDLGAPRKVRAARCVAGPLAPQPTRTPRIYTPNPRLYPGPQKVQNKQKRKKYGRSRKKTVAFLRPVLPNSRLYRPAPPKPQPPPANPRTVWHPPAQGKLETASRAALRLNEIWWSDQSEESVPQPPGSPPVLKNRSPLRQRSSSSPSHPRKLVVKLPAAAGDGNPSEPSLRYHPASRHFRDRELGSRDSTPTGGRVIHQSARGNMEAAPRHSTSPEDCSEGNDSQSAPSEFLAEFLSAIMRRQYAEALKYCRLILQYEPRNATARGFYPLLQQKLAQSPRTSDKSSPPRSRHQRSKASRSPDLGGASSDANSGASSPVPQSLLPHEVMEQEADSLSCSEPRPGSAGSSEAEPGLGSVSSQSSLELDSSAAHSSPSLSLSRRTDSASASGTWDSSGSGARDDNGNPAPATAAAAAAAAAAARTGSPKSYLCDAENNQPSVSTVGRSPRRARAAPLTLQSEQSTESLRRLRAQFACSIK
ncbi:protein couch potato isoform X2 [Leguminivora glycinivorella]|uniref:protein couch potato isoform X2 n=1 Tax=Leguminivora glycinivorella TaxID=1035111 RepID=UPI00200BD7D7|nr:protein couch potato isoform X2 [Leguminivora glycinivorella]